LSCGLLDRFFVGFNTLSFGFLRIFIAPISGIVIVCELSPAVRGGIEEERDLPTSSIEKLKPCFTDSELSELFYCCSGFRSPKSVCKGAPSVIC
jgi:hypothetical protein